tara:strand:- start:145 stop:540 length:396 start_codon:yes stop_codon:yes gene_type:complete
MGFLGGSLVLESGFTSEDKKEAYYIIDGLKYDLEIQKNDEEVVENIKVEIIFNVYITREDRLLRQNLIETRTYERIINRSEIDTLSLSEYYIYCKPLIIEDQRRNVIFKLGLDISDEVPSEYSEYYHLTDN